MNQSLNMATARTGHRRRRQIPWEDLGALIALLILAFLFLTPIVWLLSSALKSKSDMLALPVQIFPAVLRWENFYQAVTLINFGQYGLNTLLLSTIYATLTTLSCAVVGFGFARLRGKGKRIWFGIMISTLMLPFMMTVIPTYVLFSRVGLVGTYWPWVLWGLAASPFLSFLFRQFFLSIPSELEEAAIIDGCGYGRIFWQIFLPLSKPVIATAAILSFVGTWGDWLTPSIFLNSDNTTLGVAMSGGYTDIHGDVLPNVLAAGSLLYILPVMVIFFFAQRYFVQGIIGSGLKG